MSTKPRMLLVSTQNDPSLSLFYEPESSELIESVSLMYNSSAQEIDQLFKQRFNFIYFRDPFNHNVPNKLVKSTTERLLNYYSSAYKIDSILSYTDMLFEDKLRQNELFSEIMPPTQILTNLGEVNFDKQIIKKRISSRSKGIILSRSSFPVKGKLDDYAVQRKMDISKEYRVYAIGGEIIKPLAIKSSKNSKQRVRIVEIDDNIPDELVKMVQSVAAKTDIDLMGLDIAETDDGYYLLEVNRSCQFKGYRRLSQKNLAVMLNKYLLGLHKANH